MSKQIVLVLQRVGMMIIVTVMLLDHFVFRISEEFILTIAIVSAILLTVSINVLKCIEIREECSETYK